MGHEWQGNLIMSVWVKMVQWTQVRKCFCKKLRRNDIHMYNFSAHQKCKMLDWGGFLIARYNICLKLRPPWLWILATALCRNEDRTHSDNRISLAASCMPYWSSYPVLGAVMLVQTAFFMESHVLWHQTAYQWISLATWVQHTPSHPVSLRSTLMLSPRLHIGLQRGYFITANCVLISELYIYIGQLFTK
jgi:hypothetical protein